MIICTKCGTQLEDGAKFCLECGTAIPQTKKCIKCGTELPLAAKFCPECGTKQDGSSTTSNTGLNMGDKNVIAGDVIGHKEETHVAGNATFIKNEDQTKQVKKCHICGSLIQIVQGYDCPACGQFTCKACYNQQEGMCCSCIDKKQTNNEEKYKDAIKMALADGKIEFSERNRLIGLQQELNISSKRAKEIEDELNIIKTVEFTTADKLNLEKAKSLFYKNCSFAEAYDIIEPIYQNHKDKEEVLNVFIPILARYKEKQAVDFINKMQIDIPMAYLTAIDISIRNKEFPEAENKIKQALRIWPDNFLLKCYQVLYNCTLYNEYHNNDFIEKAKNLIDQLGQAQDELELSMQVKVQAILQVLSGEDSIDFTEDFCNQNHLYWLIMKDFFFSQNNVEKKSVNIKIQTPQQAFNETKSPVNEIVVDISDMYDALWKIKGDSKGTQHIKVTGVLDKKTYKKIYENGCNFHSNLRSNIEISEKYNNIKLSIKRASLDFSDLEVQYFERIYLDGEKNFQIESIIFPRNITTLNFNLRENSFSRIEIPETVNVLKSDFSKCYKLSEIQFPEYLQELGGYSFIDCKSLHKIELPDTLQKIGDLAFSGCENLTSLTLPNSLIEIGEAAFFDCYKLSSLTIPDSVTKISSKAFKCSYKHSTSLKEVTIPRKCKVQSDSFDERTIVSRR